MGWHQRIAGRARPRRRRPVVEGLESRAMLSVAGTDYVLSGSQWTNPSLIRFSVAPDGTSWGVGSNNLNSSMDARFPGQDWRREIARALQTWASVANVNFTPVPDSGLPMGATGQSQGDLQFGDIRFGGYAFSNPTTLALTYLPPPAGGTISGDLQLNTAMDWGLGSGIDFFSVVLHETGHSLGLKHPTDPTEVMAATYGGVRHALEDGDVAGIQAIYGPRQPDVFRQRGLGTSFATAVDLSPMLTPAKRVDQGGLGLMHIGDAEYFSVVVPAGTNQLWAAALAGGQSLMSPKLDVYDASGRLILSRSNPNDWGNNVHSGPIPVAPGERYFIAVTGATSDVFAIGNYQLSVAFAEAPILAPIASVIPAAPVVLPPMPAPMPVEPPPIRGQAVSDSMTPAPASAGQVSVPITPAWSRAGLNARSANFRGRQVPTFPASFRSRPNVGVDRMEIPNVRFAGNPGRGIWSVASTLGDSPLRGRASLLGLMPRAWRR